MPRLPVKPFGNSYWIRPGQLLAGEYPLSRNDAESASRLQQLLQAGITCFIDLTAIDERLPYAARLPAQFAGKPVVHQRFAIQDHGVPEALQHMTAILDAIDAGLAKGCVYVHCHAGIGRTGTVIGCHLVRHGYTGVDAIKALNALWQDCGRAAQWPEIPETDEQQAFILKFREQTAAKPLLTTERTRLDTYQGALLGLAIGDVVGAALAVQAGVNAAAPNKEVLATINNLATLHWGSDTAMTLALADSLLSCKQMQAQDQMQRYLAWHKQGQYSSGQAAIVPQSVQKALGLWQWKRNPLAGSHDPAMLDAHPLARCTPVALYFTKYPLLAQREAAESARTTAQAPLVLDACRVFAALLLAIVEGVPRAQIVHFSDGKAFAELRAGNLKPELERLIDGGWRTALTQPAGEDIVSVLASAIHALATTYDFQSAVFKSAYKAARPATAAAVCGALAGALYGVQGLPLVWRETLPKVHELLALSERLLLVQGNDN